MKILLILGICAIALTTVFAQGKADIPFQIVERGTNSGEKQQGLKVLRTERAFEELLKDKSEDHVKKLSKQVDWQTEQVVVVFGGEFNTGGYGVDIKRVTNVDVQRLLIEATISKPRHGQGVTMAFTTPYVIIKMPRQVASVRVKFLTD